MIAPILAKLPTPLTGAPVPASNDPPRLSPETPQKPPSHNLLPEGTYLSGRNAKLIKRDGDPSWFLALESARAGGKIAGNQPISAYAGWNYDPNSRDPLERPIEILPGKWLVTMNNISGNRVNPTITFCVWGEVTAYRDRNYILPSLVTMVAMMEKSTASKPEKNQQTAFLAPADKAAPPAAVSIPDLPANLKQALEAIPRLKPLPLTPESQVEQARLPAAPQPRLASGGSSGVASPRKEGEMVIDRVGRLIFDPEEKNWTFVFEADGGSLAEPPVLLHPCRLLEVMETAAAKATRPIKFRVSGQITKYQARTYMLLRKVLVAYDLGNLGK